MKILALETATEMCSCAVYADGAVYAVSELAPRRHAELILPMADAMLAQAGIRRSDLEGIAFGRGPGSFTGLRIACSVAQGIGFALSVPLAPVSCLAALAQGAYREEGARRVLAALDARMEEVYWACYTADENGLMRLLPGTEEQVGAPHSVTLHDEGLWWGAGNVWQSYPEHLGERLEPRLQTLHAERYPHAQDLLPAALERFMQAQASDPAQQAMPVYLRNRVVQRS